MDFHSNAVLINPFKLIQEKQVPDLFLFCSNLMKERHLKDLLIQWKFLAILRCVSLISCLTKNQFFGSKSII